MKIKIQVLMLIVLVGSIAFAAIAAQAQTIYVYNLQPNWTAPGGGGVWSAYYGPPAYNAVSPGSTAIFDGRSAGIIKAGLAIDPTYLDYEDEGLFAFQVPNVNFPLFATQTLSYDVQNQWGANPVWVRIRLVGGNQYQFVPTSNPMSWHTVNAAAGMWQQMDTSTGNAFGPPLPLALFAAANSSAQVDRVYLTLGMGNSYHDNPNGTVGWVDKVTIGRVTYDFVVRNPATNKDQCKNNGWKTRTRLNGSPFKNQGDCIDYVNGDHHDNGDDGDDNDHGDDDGHGDGHGDGHRDH